MKSEEQISVVDRGPIVQGPLAQYAERAFARYQKMASAFPGWCTAEKARGLIETMVAASESALLGTQGGSWCSLSVEIGVFGGQSLAAIACACEELGAPHVARVFGVDPWSVDEALVDMKDAANTDWWRKVDYEKIYAELLRNVADHKISRATTILRMTSARAAGMFKDAELALLHLDGNHSESGSTHDVRLWLPKVVVGGYIWFDDMRWQENGTRTTLAAQQILLETCDLVRVINDGDCGLFRKRA